MSARMRAPACWRPALAPAADGPVERAAAVRVRSLVALAVCGLALAAAAPAAAQPRLDVTVSGAWWDGYGLGPRTASITGPQAPAGSPVTLFDTHTSIQPGGGAELRLGWRVFQRVYAEATGGIGMNAVETRISNDVEQAPPVAVASSLTQITIEGGALVEVTSLRAGAGALVPFVTGGGGYLRQVHEDRVLIETGGTVYAGGGVKWQSAAPTPRGFVDRLLVRADVRYVSRSGGTDVEDSRRRGYITVSGGVGVRLF